MNTTSRTRGRLQGVVLLGASSLLCLVLLEGGIRLALGPPAAINAVGGSYRDVQTDFDVTYGVTSDGRQRVTCTSGKARSAGEKRVAIVGDSFVFGQGVQDAETFPYLVDCALPELRVENFGQVGIATTEYTQIVEQLLDESYDAVVVVFYGNDLLIGPSTPFQRLHRTLTYHLSVFALMRRAMNRIRLQSFDAGSREAGTTPNNPAMSLAVNPRLIWEHVHAPPDSQARFRAQYARLVRALLDKVDAQKIIVACIPEGGTISPRLADWYRRSGADPMPDLDEPGESYELVARLTREHGLRFVDLYGELQAHPEYYFPRDFHLNARGHEALGRILIESLSTTLTVTADR